MPVYFDKQSKTWYCKFYYTDYTGTRKQKKKRGFKLQREAKEWEHIFLLQKQGRPDMGFSSLYSLYMEDMTHRLRQSTLSSKAHLFRTKILPYFEKLPVNEIQASNIRQWQNKMTSYRTPDGKGYSQTYLKAMNNQLSAIFNYAVKYYCLPSNPCHTAGSIGRKKASEMDFWTQNEFFAFWKSLPEHSELSLVFSLLYYSGMRIGELLALETKDFHPATGVISITKTLRRYKGENIVTPPKTPKGVREIRLPEFLVKNLKKYVFGRDISERIFSCSRHTIDRAMQKHCFLSGVKKIRIHDLRHSNASLLIEMGISPVLIAERLGHENVETTLNTYSHLYPGKQDEIAVQMQKLHEILQEKQFQSST